MCVTNKAGFEVLKSLERYEADYKRKCRVLTPLNNVFGIDFNKDFDVIHVDGKWTIKSLNNKAQTAGHNAYTSIMVAIIKIKESKKEDYRYLSNRLYCFRLYDTSYDNDYKFYRLKNYYYSGLDNLWRKGDIEDYRKSGDFETFLICQYKDNLSRTYTAPDDHNTDLEQRFKIHGKKGIYSRLELQTEAGTTFSYHNYSKDEKLENIIDKSGYIINVKRYNLQRKAKELRNERKANEFKQTDNTATINALQDRITLLKNTMIEEFKQATTCEELEIIGKRIYNYSGLATTVQYFEQLKEKDAKKEYPSIESFNNAVKEINDRIDVLFKRG